jgi:hypothetical protein
LKFTQFRSFLSLDLEIAHALRIIHSDRWHHNNPFSMIKNLDGQNSSITIDLGNHGYEVWSSTSGGNNRSPNRTSRCYATVKKEHIDQRHAMQM